MIASNVIDCILNVLSCRLKKNWKLYDQFTCCQGCLVEQQLHLTSCHLCHTIRYPPADPCVTAINKVMGHKDVQSQTSKAETATLQGKRDFAGMWFRLQILARGDCLELPNGVQSNHASQAASVVKRTHLPVQVGTRDTGLILGRKKPLRAGNEIHSRRSSGGL